MCLGIRSSKCRSYSDTVKAFIKGAIKNNYDLQVVSPDTLLQILCAVVNAVVKQAFTSALVHTLVVYSYCVYLYVLTAALFALRYG